MQLLRDVFGLFGLTAVGIRHPELVLDVARHEQPDLFVIDMMLPGRSGVEVAEELRHGGFAHVPMLALSASPVMRDLAMHTGVFDAALTKPFDMQRLMRCIWSLLDAPTPQQSVTLPAP
jgi:CheY-like chemotaxis protein